MTFPGYERSGGGVERFPRVGKARCRIACLLLALAPSLACDHATSPTDQGASPITELELELELETEHFSLLYSQADADKMDAYATELETAYPRITADLDQKDLPRIVGRFYPDQASYTAFTGHGSLGSVQDRNLFSIVTVPFKASVPVHEFAHCVTLHLDGQAGNNPTWLWEAVAVYEARDLVNPLTVPCLASRNFPTLAQLNVRGGSCDIYQVGYTLTEYIVEGWGFAGLRDLIVAHGDPRESLGMSIEELQAGWWRFLEERYL